MPLYQYLCEECGYYTDVMVPLARYGEVLECPKCGNETFHPSMTAPRFIIY